MSISTPVRHDLWCGVKNCMVCLQNWRMYKFMDPRYKESHLHFEVCKSFLVVLTSSYLCCKQMGTLLWKSSLQTPNKHERQGMYFLLASSPCSCWARTFIHTRMGVWTAQSKRRSSMVVSNNLVVYHHDFSRAFLLWNNMETLLPSSNLWYISGTKATMHNVDPTVSESSRNMWDSSSLI